MQALVQRHTRPLGNMHWEEAGTWAVFPALTAAAGFSLSHTTNKLRNRRGVIFIDQARQAMAPALRR